MPLINDQQALLKNVYNSFYNSFKDVYDSYKFFIEQKICLKSYSLLMMWFNNLCFMTSAELLSQ